MFSVFSAPFTSAVTLTALAETFCPLSASSKMSYFSVKMFSPSTSACGVVRVITKLSAFTSVSPTFVEPKKSDALLMSELVPSAENAIFVTCMAGSVSFAFTVTVRKFWPASLAATVSGAAADAVTPSKSMACGVNRLTSASKPSAAMSLLASLNSTTVSEPSSAVERTLAVSPFCKVFSRFASLTVCPL